MTTMTLSTSATDTHTSAGARLHHDVKRSAFRGCLVQSMGGALLAFALFVSLLLTVVVADMVSPMPTAIRLVLLVFVAVVSGAMGIGGMLRPWFARDRHNAVAQRIEQAAGVTDQPVIRGLTMQAAPEGDALASALRERVERHAASVAHAAEPRRVYPASAIGRQGRWLWLACVGWVVIALVFPSQLLGVFSRALLPWFDSAPFSLTQLEPHWTPEQPIVGDDVDVHVVPQGVDPLGVDFVRIDEQGEEVERFAMQRDEAGGFTHALQAVREPIRFKLEASGRQTQAYTIAPEPPAGQADNNDTTESAPLDPPDDSAGGNTTFDAEAVARRDALNSASWKMVEADLDALLKALSDAEAVASALSTDDAEGIQSLAEQLAALTKQAEALSESLAAARAALPAAVSASLATLQDVLDQMADTQVPPPPTGGPGQTQTQGEPIRSASQQWLEQAEQTTRAQQAQLAQGLGEADLVTDSGTTSGGNDGEAPTFTDPQARGGYDESGGSADVGPLPDAVLQQVPPGYRAHVAAYFDALARPETETGASP